MINEENIGSDIRKPNMLEFTKDLALAVADFYEYSMAEANILEDIVGKDTVFDMVVRRMPTNKVVGRFERDGVKYDELEQRKYLINAGLEQVAAYFLEARGTEKLRNYMQEVQGVENTTFLDWVENISFQGDVYAMPEGTIFFAQEHQLRVHEKFEEAQVFESLLLNTINPQTNVASTANDIAQVANKILLEGGSRRATSPQSSVFNSRAARIGGFTASSNVAYGMFYHEKVGGTHGHSYVMLHPDEYSSFKAQSELFGNKVCLLLDTYNVEEAFEISLKIVEEENFDSFAFRIDSGDLLQQAKWIHDKLQEKGYARESYVLVASDDLTAGKIDVLEKERADIDKYLVGTYVVNPPKPVPGVFKLAAYKNDNNNQEVSSDEENNGWILKGKLSEEFSKATLPGIKQVYRVVGEDGFYKKDIIAFEGEDLSEYLDENDTVEELLVSIIKGGKQVYNFPTINGISQRREEQLSRFNNIGDYEILISSLVLKTQQQIMEEHGFYRRN